jgi:hypothetical protein
MKTPLLLESLQVPLVTQYERAKKTTRNKQEEYRNSYFPTFNYKTALMYRCSKGSCSELSLDRVHINIMIVIGSARQGQG